MNTNGIFSRKTDDWKTPLYIYNQVIEKHYFDPCPFHADFDGLNIEWGSNNFVNPPYSQMKQWIVKAIEEHRKQKNVIMLLPARTDTQWFNMLAQYGCICSFIIGRLKYNDFGTAPFPSMLVVLTGAEYLTQI